MKKLLLLTTLVFTTVSLQAQLLTDQKNNDSKSFEYAPLFGIQKSQTPTNFLNVMQDLVKESHEKNGITSTKKEIKNESYETRETYDFYVGDYDNPDYQVTFPNTEVKTTKGYIEETFSIPASCTIAPYITTTYDPSTGKHIPYFLGQDKYIIFIHINNDTRHFNLDWEVTLKDESLLNDPDEKTPDIRDIFNKSDKKIIVRYSPNYFTLVQSHKNANKNVALQDNTYPVKNNYGLKVEVAPIFYTKTNYGEETFYYLVPNFDNIYNDFKFVRNGHREPSVKYVGTDEQDK